MPGTQTLKRGIESLRVPALKILSLLFLFASLGAAAEFQVPKLKHPVNDYARVVSPRTESELNQALHRLKKATGIQMALLTVKTLGGESIEAASIKTTDLWKLGQADSDKGLLIMIAKKERQLRIEVGQGLEADITDAYAKRVISETMVPLIRQGEMDAAVLTGFFKVIQKAAPQVNPQSLFSKTREFSNRRQRPPSNPLWSIIKLIFFIILLIVIGPRNFLWFAMGAALGGRGGGFGRSGGGFGGYSGGGGGFSGGGASGGW